jgi:hypothetical protein
VTVGVAGYNHCVPADDSDLLLIEQACERGRVLLDAVGQDARALRADAEFADGASLCDAVADAIRQLITELDEAAASNSSNERTPL